MRMRVPMDAHDTNVVVKNAPYMTMHKMIHAHTYATDIPVRRVF